MDQPRRRLVPGTLLGASAVFWLAAALFYNQTRPEFGEATVRFLERAPQTFTYPLEIEKTAPRTRFVVEQSLYLGEWRPTTFAFYPEDALWKIEVNDHGIDAPGLPLSVVHHEGRVINLGQWLRPGRNRLVFNMEAYWGDAALHIYPAATDWVSMFLTALVLLATGFSGAFIMVLFGVEIAWAESVLLLGGFLLRWIYLQGTPHFVRSYDWWGHEAYLEYVAQHLALPEPRSGWENFQPPLYYGIVGSLMRLLEVTGEARYALWQGFALLCSGGVLVAGAWIARSLYEHDLRRRLYLMAVLGVAPPLVFNASRVSNDVLLSLLEFVWLGLLLRLWRGPGWPAWLGLCLITGLALLTKANALALVPIALLCLAILPGTNMRWKIAAMLALLAIGGAMTGWYYGARASAETGVDSFVVGNIHQLNRKGHIDGVLAKSLVFNPARVLRFPFADAWGPRREYFLEYFFRSIFLGESLGASYRWVARVYLVVALLAVPFVLMGVGNALRARAAYDLPMLVVAAVVFLAQWAFVQIAPYTSSQDFRFSALLLVPLTYFYGEGISALPAKWQSTGFFLLQILILNAVIYLLEMALAG